MDCSAHKELNGVFQGTSLQELRRRENELIAGSLDDLELTSGDGDGARLGHADAVHQAFASVCMEGVISPVGLILSHLK